MRAWTLYTRTDAYERKGLITRPFTPDGRALARAASESWYFALFLTEMPARLSDDDTFWLDWGITSVRKKRGDLPSSLGGDETVRPASRGTSV